MAWHQLLVRCQPKKQLQRGGGSGTKGKSYGNNARQGEGSDLSVLALLSLNELLCKRTETDVAFTREYTWGIESKER